jgi:alpha-1,3-rhamnosyl/mannosyltransferase
MVAALDATPLTLPSGGLRRYTEELARALGRCFPADTFHLISDQPFSPPAHLPGNVHAHTSGARTALERKWWSAGANICMLRLGCDLFHGTDFAVPYLPIRPSVMTLHDLSPWMDPEWHGGASRVRRRTPPLVRLGIVTMIVTHAEAVRRQAIEHFDLPPGRVVAVPCAAAPQLRPCPPAAHNRRYFLFAGTVEPRKNVTAIIAAWHSVRRHHDVDLIVAGRRRADAPEIDAQPGLVLAGEVVDDTLAALYSGAVACIYPSFYEGFGLPPLEAMQCGCPVIASRDPALLEISAGTAIHVDAANVAALAAAMQRLLEHDDERRRLRDSGLRRASQFSWERTARMTREVYAEAIRRFA